MSQRAHGTAGPEPVPEAGSGRHADVTSYLVSRGLAADSDRAQRLLRELLELPVRHREGRVTLSRAARALHTSRRTLVRRCRRAGLPAPSRILAFGRVLYALQLMRRTAWSVARVAAAAGWPDPFTLSNSMHELAGFRPSVARGHGPVYLAEAWLRREVSAGRAELRSPQPPSCPSCGQEVAPPGGG